MIVFIHEKFFIKVTKKLTEIPDVFFNFLICLIDFLSVILSSFVKKVTVKYWKQPPQSGLQKLMPVQNGISIYDMIIH